MLLAAFVLLAAPYSFPGGTLDQLVDSLHSHYGTSIVAGVYEPDVVPKFACKTDDLDTLAKTIAAKTAFTLRREGTCLAVAPQRLPSCVLAAENQTGYMPNRKLAAEDDIKVSGGNVSGGTKPGQAIEPVQLYVYRWPERLAVHDLFSHYGLLIRADGAKGSDVLASVAYCLGGALTETNGAQTIDFDPTAWRARLRATVDDPHATYPDSAIRSGRFVALSMKVLLAATDRMSDAFLRERFAHMESSYANVAIPQDGPLRGLCQDRIDELAAGMRRAPLLGTQVSDDTMRLFEQIDFDRPFAITYCAPVRIGLDYLDRSGARHIVL